jgi:hypothetical protein
MLRRPEDSRKVTPQPGAPIPASAIRDLVAVSVSALAEDLSKALKAAQERGGGPQFDHRLKLTLEHLLQMSGGYVMDFSNATFADFVESSTGFDPYTVYS